MKFDHGRLVITQSFNNIIIYWGFYSILVFRNEEDDKKKMTIASQIRLKLRSTAMRQILQNGYCVLESFINEESCDKLRNYLLNKYNQNKSDLSYNYFDGHYQIHLPNNLDNIYVDIIFNHKIHSILKNILGSNYYLSSYTCNANISLHNQPYHMDCSHFHPLQAIKLMGSCGPPHQIKENIYLQDTNESNGSFDLIEKSHLITDFSMDENGEIVKIQLTKLNIK